MNTTAKTISLLFMLAPLSTFADQRSMLEYECAHLNSERDGATCIIKDNEMGPELIFRIHTLHGAPKEKWERTGYVIDTLSHNYIVAGGISIEHRKINKSKARVERSCGRLKQEMAIFCNPWHPATTKWE